MEHHPHRHEVSRDYHFTAHCTSAARAILALFVDDGPYVVAIAIWLGLMGLFAPQVLLPATWEGPLLTMGLVAIFILSVQHAARSQATGNSSTSTQLRM